MPAAVWKLPALVAVRTIVLAAGRTATPGVPASLAITALAVEAIITGSGATANSFAHAPLTMAVKKNTASVRGIKNFHLSNLFIFNLLS
jgi:hypothetical protein